MQSNSTNKTNPSAIIDSLIADCNNAVKLITGGNYIAWCGAMVQVVQKLMELNENINNDIQDRNNKIEALKRELHAANEANNKPMKGAEDNGCN
jgi:hypothetical protein